MKWGLRDLPFSDDARAATEGRPYEDASEHHVVQSEMGRKTFANTTTRNKWKFVDLRKRF